MCTSPRLVQQTASLSLLVNERGEQLFQSTLPMFLVDKDSYIVGRLTGWLDILSENLGNTGNSVLPALFISGLVKVCDLQLTVRHAFAPLKLLTS